MALQYRFFIIPAANSEESESELNRFLRSVRIITIHREFVANGQNSFWAMAAEYLSGSENNKTASSGKKKVDYREVLSPENFAIYSKLRDWRKFTADQEGIPVYNILTNEQMAHIVEKRIITKAALGEIEGIGDARVKKYGDTVIGIMSEIFKGSEHETERQSVSSDSHA